ncbi:MAG: CHASE domain-containing protein [Candidatus Bathyarchaeota archaeon]|nr:CHASE domain-containing protein [Candidatus Bathyarchaeota archaeon]
MSKFKLVAIILAVALIASVIANVYLVTQTSPNQSTNDTVRVGMVDTINQIQVQADAEIDRMGQSLIYASEQLTTSGLTGTQADTILSALAANSTFIVDAGTQNLDRIMVAVQPPEYNSIIGMDVGEQKWLNPNPLSAITPVMTPVIPMVENFSGVAIAAPVFDSNRDLIGVVSVIFDPQVLLDAVISEVTQDPQYEFTVMQPNGLMMFDSNPDAQGKNLFTNSEFADNTDIINVGHQIAQDSAGYSTYATGDDQQKQCYWNTISNYGGEWRLIIHHIL